MILVLFYILCELACSVESSNMHTAEFARQCLQSNNSGTHQRSVIACSDRCLGEPATCKGFIFDKYSKTCTLVGDDDSFTTCTERPAGSGEKSYIRVGVNKFKTILKVNYNPTSSDYGYYVIKSN